MGGRLYIHVGGVSVCVIPSHPALVRAGQKLVSDAKCSSHGKVEPVKNTVSVKHPYTYVCVCLHVCVFNITLTLSLHCLLQLIHVLAACSCIRVMEVAG